MDKDEFILITFVSAVAQNRKNSRNKKSFFVAQHLSSQKNALLIDFICFELKQHLPEVPRI